MKSKKPKAINKNPKKKEKNKVINKVTIKMVFLKILKMNLSS